MVTIIEDRDATYKNADRYTLKAGDDFRGYVLSDTDTIALRLKAGEVYRVTLTADTGSNPSGRLLESALSGVITYLQDTDEHKRRSHLITVEEDTKIYLAINASSWGSTSYTVKLRKANVTEGTTDDFAQQLTTDFWEGSDTPPPVWKLNASRTLKVDLSGLSENAQERAQWALDTWSHYSGITFVHGGKNSDITFVTGFGKNGTTLSFKGGQLDHAQINVTKGVTRGDPVFADKGHYTLLREVGHALGLGDTDNVAGRASYANDALFLNDTQLMSVMSSFDANTALAYADFWDGSPVTPMAADIAAIEQLYGPVEVNPGKTVYGTSTLKGQPFGLDLKLDGSGGIYSRGGHLMTIKDDGGIDRIDLSAFPRGVSLPNEINLTPGAISNLHFWGSNRVVIDESTIIENATGSNFVDQITGNHVGNILKGLGGRDEIQGGDGRDQINGGDGWDKLFGDNGQDRVSGGKGNDKLWGGDGRDILRGDTGRDKLDGGAGRDRLVGGQDADTFVFAAGNQRDKVVDFQFGQDSLLIEADGWGETLTTNSLRAMFSDQSGDTFVLAFSDRDVLTIQTDVSISIDDLALQVDFF